MLSTTDDLRIRELKELSTPGEVMGEIPRTLTATRIVMARAQRHSRHPQWRRRSPPCRRRPLLDP